MEEVKKEMGELKRMIYEYVEGEMNENRYELRFKADGFASDGYMESELEIGGYTIRCGINKKGFICWFHGDVIDVIGDAIEKIEGMTQMIVDKAVAHAKEHEIEFKEERIKQLRKELEELKK